MLCAALAQRQKEVALRLLTPQAPGNNAQNTAVTYAHDGAGALTKKGDSHLHYGIDGRITKTGLNASASHPQAVSYTYNLLGQRLLKSDARLTGNVGTPTTQQTVYADDGIGSTVLGQYRNQRSTTSGAPAGEMDSTEVIYLRTASGPMPIATQINGRLYAIDSDHLNTPRRLTNSQGQVAWQWLISGYGEVAPTTGAQGYAQNNTGSRNYSEAIKFDLRYPGQQWDEETGLAYNLHRYYDAATGRYVQADPIGLEGGWNRFGYVDGDPLNFADDEGLQKRGSTPAVSWGQAQLNFQGISLTNQIRQYQPNYAPTYASAPGQGFTAANIGQLRGTLQRLQSVSRCDAEPIARDIAGGHAFEKHVLNRGEFRGLDIRTRNHFSDHVQSIISNPTAFRELSRGRSAYWDAGTGTVVITNPRASDGGTAFRPSNGVNYFNGLR